jgi:hypothetical protein
MSSGVRLRGSVVVEEAGASVALYALEVTVAKTSWVVFKCAPRPGRAIAGC